MSQQLRISSAVPAPPHAGMRKGVYGADQNGSSSSIPSSSSRFRSRDLIFVWAANVLCCRQPYSLPVSTISCFACGQQAGAVELTAELEVRNFISRKVAGWLTDFDVLLTPTLPRLPQALSAYSLYAEYWDSLRWAAR